MSLGTAYNLEAECVALGLTRVWSNTFLFNDSRGKRPLTLDVLVHSRQEYEAIWMGPKGSSVAGVLVYFNTFYGMNSVNAVHTYWEEDCHNQASFTRAHTACSGGLCFECAGGRDAVYKDNIKRWLRHSNAGAEGLWMVQEANRHGHLVYPWCGHNCCLPWVLNYMETPDDDHDAWHRAQVSKLASIPEVVELVNNEQVNEAVGRKV
jgi:hypothetical protein